MGSWIVTPVVFDMVIDTALLPGAIAELFAQTSVTGRLTLADRYGLMSAICQECLSDDEREAIDRLLRSVRRGHLKTVDELSIVL